jgi:hypothetical protein
MRLGIIAQATNTKKVQPRRERKNSPPASDRKQMVIVCVLKYHPDLLSKRIFGIIGSIGSRIKLSGGCRKARKADFFLE